MRWVALVAWVAVLPGCMHHADGPDEVVVFAAASLTDALETMTESFHALHPSRRLVLNTGATSILARQIAQGAPADVLLSANEAWMYYLAACERLDGVARPLAGNRLVVAGPGEVRPLADPAGMLRLNSIALADPSHVPAGAVCQGGTGVCRTLGCGGAPDHPPAGCAHGADRCEKWGLRRPPSCTRPTCVRLLACMCCWNGRIPVRRKSATWRGAFGMRPTRWVPRPF